jgi:hypothetical protein
LPSPMSRRFFCFLLVVYGFWSSFVYFMLI